MPSDLIHWDPKTLLVSTLKAYLGINQRNREQREALWYWWLPLPTGYPSRLRGYDLKLAEKKARMVGAKIEDLERQSQYLHVMTDPQPNILLERKNALQTEVDAVLNEIMILLKADSLLIQQHNKRMAWLLTPFWGSGQGDLRMQLDVCAQLLGEEFPKVQAALNQAIREYIPSAVPAVPREAPPPYRAEGGAFQAALQKSLEDEQVCSAPTSAWLPMAWNGLRALASSAVTESTEPTMAKPPTPSAPPPKSPYQ